MVKGFSLYHLNTTNYGGYIMSSAEDDINDKSVTFNVKKSVRAVR